MELLKSLLRYALVGLGLIRRPDLVVRLVTDHPAPEAVAPGIIYIVGGARYRKWAVFLCPQHQEEVIQLSLMSNRRPNWSIDLDVLGRPTLHPSVRQLDGSFAHFWVRSGQVDWCSDSGNRMPTTTYRV